MVEISRLVPREGVPHAPNTSLAHSLLGCVPLTSVPNIPIAKDAFTMHSVFCASTWSRNDYMLWNSYLNSRRFCSRSAPQNSIVLFEFET